MGMPLKAPFSRRLDLEKWPPQRPSKSDRNPNVEHLATPVGR